jgi:hypothetical protein
MIVNHPRLRRNMRVKRERISRGAHADGINPECGCGPRYPDCYLPTVCDQNAFEQRRTPEQN